MCATRMFKILIIQNSRTSYRWNIRSNIWIWTVIKRRPFNGVAVKDTTPKFNSNFGYGYHDHFHLRQKSKKILYLEKKQNDYDILN